AIPVDQLVECTGILQSDARAELGLGGHRIVMLIGIVRDYKGLAFLGDVWPMLHSEDPDAELHIVGKVAEQSEDLSRLVDMDGVIVHDAWLPEGKFNQWAAAADVCVLPYESGVHSGVLHRVVANATHVIVSPSLEEEASRYTNIPVVRLDPAAWVSAVLLAEGTEVPQPPEEATMGRDTVRFYNRICGTE
ncbi:MAG: glycosyltransferase, partial [Acidimicrobiales bacterium]